MPRFAANISLLYPEHAFVDRFAAAAQDGFRAVECQFPYDHAPAVLAQRLADHGLQMVLLNAPPGAPDRRDHGHRSRAIQEVHDIHDIHDSHDRHPSPSSSADRGLACLPGRVADFRRSIALALNYAQALACPRIHVMAGLAPADADRARLLATYQDNLAWAAEQAGAAGCDVLIEPINARDMPGYFLSRQDEAHRVVQAVGAPNLKVQMDLYHCQITEGDVATKLRHYLPTGRVGHLQIAGVPERHEPDVGELHHAYLFQVIDEVAASCGWDGWVGCEYRPRRGAQPGGTTAGLGWWR